MNAYKVLSNKLNVSPQLYKKKKKTQTHTIKRKRKRKNNYPLFFFFCFLFLSYYYFFRTKNGMPLMPVIMNIITYHTVG